MNLEPLKIACDVCESGAVLERYKHIVFDENQVRAFNGVVSFEAPFDLDGERFAVNEERLSRALSACEGEDLKVSQTKDFLVFKQGKLTIRVRKADPDAVFTAKLEPPSGRSRASAGGILDAIRQVAPFVSADASRPWSVAALVKDGYAWATNNLSLVRCPIVSALKSEREFFCRIPAVAIPLMLMLPEAEWIARKETNIFLGVGGGTFAFPENAAEWPDVEKFFAGMPKTMPLLDPALLVGAKTIEKFSDRFISLNNQALEGKSATMESEYEVQVEEGKGTYSARLLSLILTHATHADFSPFPKPIYFRGPRIEGTATGVVVGA